MSVQLVVTIGGVPVPVTLDDVAVDVISTVVTDRIRAPGAPSWLYGARAAADHLGWPLGRVEKLAAAGAMPCHRIGRRLAFRRDELDVWLTAQEGGRA